MTIKDKFNRYRGGKSQRQCAAEIGVADKHLSRVLNGHVRCGRRLAERIETWSGGKLPAVWFVFPDKTRPA